MNDDVIGINLLWMVPGTVGGSETYTTRLLHGLAERGSRLRYVLFALPTFEAAHPDIASRFEVRYAPLSGQVKSFRVAGENTWLLRQCRKQRVALIHHAGGIVPLVHAARPVLTIHDLQYLYFPEYFTRAKLTYLRTMIPRSAEAARLILTPSAFTRRTVIERLHIDPEIVRVIPHGISPRPPQGARDVRKHYGLPGPFFIYPAATYPHKNHLLLIEAFARLRARRGDVHLALTGPRGNMMWATGVEMEKRVAHEIDARGLSASVHRLGYVPAADLDALYREATALVFPSRFEGFGAPVLEAMARGCPVIAADATSLPEVAGGAALLVSPDNAARWAEAMERVLDDIALRDELVRAGCERAAASTWSRSAELLEEAYIHALETTL